MLFVVWIPIFMGMTVRGVAHAQTTTSETSTSTGAINRAPTDDTGVLPFAPAKLFSQTFELNPDQLALGAKITTTATTSVEIPPVTSTALMIEIKELPPEELPDIAWASTTMSTVWHIDVKNPDGAIWLPKPFITVTFPAEGPFYYKKIVYFWDGNKEDWRPLPSETDFKNKTVSARYPLPYGRFIVRDRASVFEGIASWYRWENGNFAAFRHLSKKSKLKVTNISGSARDGKTVTVTVNDYGPEEWTGRLIDLDYYAYRQIGLPRGGVMPVRVEVIK